MLSDIQDKICAFQIMIDWEKIFLRIVVIHPQYDLRTHRPDFYFFSVVYYTSQIILEFRFYFSVRYLMYCDSQERYCQFTHRAGSHLGSNWLPIFALVSWCCTTGSLQTRNCIRIHGLYNSNSPSQLSSRKEAVASPRPRPGKVSILRNKIRTSCIRTLFKGGKRFCWTLYVPYPCIVEFCIHSKFNKCIPVNMFYYILILLSLIFNNTEY